MASAYSPSRSFSIRWSSQWPPGLPLHQRSDFRSGREALFALTQQLKPAANGRVLLPAWVAEGVFLPFQLANWQIDYYNLDKNADPDWEELASHCKHQHYDLVLLIHYFGQERDTQRFLSLLPDGVQLIEDWAHTYPHHNWRPPPIGHWALFSPTKIIGTTDGAWLIGPVTIKASATSGIPHLGYLLWQLLYLTGNTLQQLNIPGRNWWKKLSGGAYARAYHRLLQMTQDTAPMSKLGKWLIRHTPHELMTTRRKAQAQYYFQHLAQQHFRFLLSADFLKHPLIGFPMWVEDPVHFAAYLAEHGIRGQVFTDRWWFISARESSKFQQSHDLLQHHFLLPINQQFKLQDVAYITKITNEYQG